jgi:hypothetical protein
MEATMGCDLLDLTWRMERKFGIARPVQDGWGNIARENPDTGRLDLLTIDLFTWYWERISGRDPFLNRETVWCEFVEIVCDCLCVQPLEVHENAWFCQDLDMS